MKHRKEEFIELPLLATLKRGIAGLTSIWFYAEDVVFVTENGLEQRFVRKKSQIAI